MAARRDTFKLDDSERQPCEIWTRVMGYYRPVSAWNMGKQSEQAERVAFREPPACVPEPSGQMRLGV
jgi:anaerobic ribonucleoside-triphosphate reductase